MVRRSALFAVGLLLVADAQAAPVEGRVTRVVDGDTFYVGATDIRLCGVNAPERLAPGGAAATAWLRAMIDGKPVRCVPVGEGTVCDGRSRYSGKRLVAQCFFGNVDISAELVRQGHACDWRRFSGGAYGALGPAC